jgi:phosphosulfolactate synthase
VSGRQRAFAAIAPAPRPGKPRTGGLTAMIDWGVPPPSQHDLLEFAGDHLDLAKIAVGISSLIPESALMAKIDSYLAHGVEPFPGGQFLELALHLGRTDTYFEECRRVGYRWIEVSDNVRRLSDEERSDLIGRAHHEHGLQVLGEVGSKLAASDAATLVHDAEVALAAGARKIVVEAAEFTTSDGVAESLLGALLDAFDHELLVFELPGKWIAGVHAHEVHTTTVRLIERLGPEVNLANVAPEDVVLVETLRSGLGVTGVEGMGSAPNG